VSKGYLWYRREKRPDDRLQFAIVCLARRFELPRICRDDDLQAVVSRFDDPLIGRRTEHSNHFITNECIGYWKGALHPRKPCCVILHVFSRGCISRRSTPDLSCKDQTGLKVRGAELLACYEDWGVVVENGI
jgi:hypothetical protein